LSSGVLEPTARLLELLELLQRRPLTTGPEIAERLMVDRRTVRRYVAALKGLGIPVEGERGVGGGYRLRRGYRLPPLMLSDEEAVAVVLGLTAARRLGLAATEASVEEALAKVHRVLPDTLRGRVQALESALGFTRAPVSGEPVAGEALLLLATSIRRRRRVRARYRSFGGEETQRELSPYGLVVHAGRWYLAAHDHAREALRTFRVDRLRDAALSPDAAQPAPEGFDAVAHVSRSLARVPWPWQVEVLLDLPLAEAEGRLPETLAELEAAGERTRLRMRVSSLDWTARLLAGLGCGFTVTAPAELRMSLRELARRLDEQAERQAP
jgi:predicted DNA-binding transcriptional regulator YafY